jgi:hypothetical protein
METTLVKGDDKGRVSIRGTRKGAKYLVAAAKGGGWVTPAPEAEVPANFKSPAGAWQMRAAAMGNFYNPAKIW